jgi:hypothetical protein
VKCWAAARYGAMDARRCPMREDIRSRTAIEERRQMAKKKNEDGKPTSARSRPLLPANPKDDEGPAGVVVMETKEEPIQPPLIPDADIPAVEPTPIVNDRIVATYVGLSISRDKNEEKLCSLEFSMTLTEKHDRYLPKKVAKAHAWLVETDNKLVQVNHVKPQTVNIFDDPKEKKPILHIVGGTIERASVAMIEETGKGKTKKVIRFVFRLCIERDDKAIAFAAWRDTEQFWLEMDQTQMKIGE